jgi:hypothetical protein
MIKEKTLLLTTIFIFISLFFFSFIKTEKFENVTSDTPILNIVLYSTDNGGPYDNMQKLLQDYYKKFKSVTTYFYCCNPDLDTEYKLDGNILYIKCNEGYPVLLGKTIQAIEYFKEEIPKHKYVVRSSVTTIVRFDLLQHDLKQNSVDYGCALCFDLNNREGQPFSSGTSIIIASDVAMYMINNKDKINMTDIDDVGIGVFIKNEMPQIEMKAVFKDNPNYGFYFISNMEEDREKIKKFMKENKVVFYRNHNGGDRKLDVKQMKIIIDILNEES